MITKKQERILAIAQELQEENSLERYNEILDNMFGETASAGHDNMGEIYIFVRTLKKLIQATNSDFFSKENLKEIEFSEPRNEIEKNFSEYAKQQIF